MKRMFRMIVILAVTSLFVVSCQYKFTVEPAVIPPDPGDTISFANDIVPIWNVNNNCASCHDGQIQSLSLKPDAAYDQITSKGLVNTDIPEESIIYAYPNASSGAHTWSVYSNSDLPILLLWIEQGALNN